MNALVDWIGKKRLVAALRLPSLAGNGLPERMRSTIFALLGLTAAAGLALVAIFAQPGFPLLEPAPLPAPAAGRQALANARPLPSGPGREAPPAAVGVGSSAPVATAAPVGGAPEEFASEAGSGPAQHATSPQPPSSAGAVGGGVPQGSPPSPPSGHAPTPAPSPAPVPAPEPAATPAPASPSIAAAPAPEPAAGPGRSPSTAAAEHASERGIERSAHSGDCPFGSETSGEDGEDGEAAGEQERYLDSAHGRDEAAVPDRR